MKKVNEILSCLSCDVLSDITVVKDRVNVVLYYVLWINAKVNAVISDLLVAKTGIQSDITAL